MEPTHAMSMKAKTLIGMLVAAAAIATIIACFTIDRVTKYQKQNAAQKMVG